MAQGKYLMALAVVAGVSLFLAGVYVMEYSADDNEVDNAGIKITLTIDSQIISVTHGGDTISSDVPFYVQDSENQVTLNITVSNPGGYRLNYWPESGEVSFGNEESGATDGSTITFTAVINREFFSGDLQGTVEFYMGS